MLNQRTTIFKDTSRKNSQHTPDGSNVDFLADIHYTVVAFGEEVDPGGIDGEVNQPLVLHKEPQNCKEQ